MQHPPFPRRGAGWLRPAAAGGGQEGPFSPRVPCSDIPALPGTGLGRGGCTARARHAAASVKLGNRGKRRKGGGHALTRPRPCRGKEVAAPHGGEARPAPALPPRSPGERGVRPPAFPGASLERQRWRRRLPGGGVLQGQGRKPLSSVLFLSQEYL